jgi:hypothetical protein
MFDHLVSNLIRKNLYLIFSTAMYRYGRWSQIETNHFVQKPNYGIHMLLFHACEFMASVSARMLSRLMIQRIDQFSNDNQNQKACEHMPPVPYHSIVARGV